MKGGVISIHAPREGGDAQIGDLRGCAHCISIHAPREGGDLHDIRFKVPYIGISIHAPREGGDYPLQTAKCSPQHFNPRPPRGGRRYGKNLTSLEQEISIHAPREGGDGDCSPPVCLATISIHAPREGGDVHSSG